MTHLEVAPLSAADARALTDRIKVAVDATWQLVVAAYQGRAWEALGHGSWDDYCRAEFGSARLRLPREERAEQVASLRDAGLSIRAIAAATGTSVGTVHDDLSGVQNRTPDVEPKAITGIDGKTYESKPKAPDLAPASVGDGLGDCGDCGRSYEKCCCEKFDSTARFGIGPASDPQPDDFYDRAVIRKEVGRKISRLQKAWEAISDEDPKHFDKHDLAELRIVGRDLIRFVEQRRTPA